MITAALLDWWSGLVGALSGLVPGIPDQVQSMVDSFVLSFGTVAFKVAMLGPVVPFDVLAVCWAVLWVGIAAGLVIEVARIVLSYLTFGGGAT